MLQSTVGQWLADEITTDFCPDSAISKTAEWLGDPATVKKPGIAMAANYRLKAARVLKELPRLQLGERVGAKEIEAIELALTQRPAGTAKQATHEDIT